MTEDCNVERRGRKRKLKKIDLESVVAEAESLLASQKKKKKPSFSYFSKNPVTGVRSCHCKYRPRNSQSTSTVSGELLYFYTIRFLQFFLDSNEN